MAQMSQMSQDCYNSRCIGYLWHCTICAIWTKVMAQDGTRWHKMAQDGTRMRLMHRFGLASMHNLHLLCRVCWIGAKKPQKMRWPDPKTKLRRKIKIKTKQAPIGTHDAHVSHNTTRDT